MSSASAILLGLDAGIILCMRPANEKLRVIIETNDD